MVLQLVTHVEEDDGIPVGMEEDQVMDNQEVQDREVDENHPQNMNQIKWNECHPSTSELG